MGVSSYFQENENNKYIKNEGQIKGHPMSLTKNQTKIILEQIDNSICKIENENSVGTGFLCLIQNSDLFELQPVLITCNHILGEQNLIFGNKIKLLFENKEKIINLDNSRRIYTNDSYDITILELKKDEFPFNSFLKVDELIYNIKEEEDLNNLYKNQTIYIIHFPNGEEPKYSIDTISGIDEGLIRHCCSTDYGSSGSPILNLQTFRVIGIHRGKSTKFNFNLGTIIKLPIDLFNKSKQNLKNENNSLSESETTSLKTKIENLEKEIQELKNQIEPVSILDIISKKFFKVKGELLFEFYEHLKLSELTAIYTDEIVKKFNSKLNLIFDSKKDKNTLINFLSKIAGLSNPVAYLILTEGKTNNLVQLAYLNGKIDLCNNIFSFNTSDTFTYGNYECCRDNYQFTSFRAQNTNIFIKIKFDSIYVMLYREDYDIEFILKISQDFMKHPLISIRGRDISFGNYETDDSDEKNNEYKNIIKSKEKIDEIFEKQNKSDYEYFDLKELIIYNIKE